MSFKKNLAKLRIEKKITEEKMAKDLCCSLKEFQELESGEREPKLQELITTAKIFAVSTDFLLDNQEIKKEVSRPFDPFSALAGLALPGGFSLTPGNDDDYDDEDIELALELAEMATVIDINRKRKEKESNEKD